MIAVFLSPLITQEIDEIWFRLVAPFRVLFDPALPKLGGGFIPILEVPALFDSDGSSVPRVPIVYGVAGGRGKRGAVPHDWLYKTGIVARKIADKAFLACLLACKIATWICYAMYNAVRRWGGTHYKPRSGAVLSMAKNS